MASLNKVMLIGRLGQDPECTQVGDSLVANFSLATNEYWKDKSGEKQERTEWHKIVCWNQHAELAQAFLKSGSQVYLEGKIQTRQWENKEGEKRYTTEVKVNVIQFLDTKSDAGTARSEPKDDIPF
jgi:single-strand DNA-binding protein